MDNYPQFFLAEDGRLCSMGQQCPGFPRVFYDTLIRLGYGGEVPVYHCLLSMVDGLDVCEISVTISLNPMEPWMGTVVGSEPDTTVEQTAFVALTSLCESCLTATAAMPIALLLIRNEVNPAWKQRLEAVSDLEVPHFNTAWLLMVTQIFARARGPAAASAMRLIRPIVESRSGTSFWEL
jgi:hypothetical protein